MLAKKAEPNLEMMNECNAIMAPNLLNNQNGISSFFYVSFRSSATLDLSAALKGNPHHHRVVMRSRACRKNGITTAPYLINDSSVSAFLHDLRPLIPSALFHISRPAYSEK